eukprot:2950523-Amphidinium_carterae.3
MHASATASSRAVGAEIPAHHLDSKKTIGIRSSCKLPHRANLAVNNVCLKHHSWGRFDMTYMFCKRELHRKYQR